MFANIEKCCQLHEDVQIIYVVDGYQASLLASDGRLVFMEGKVGETILAALQNLDSQLSEVNHEDIRRLR